MTLTGMFSMDFPSRLDILSTKKSTSRAMSSTRSRSGGAVIGKIFSRYQRSSRNRPRRTSSSRLRLVAAITRTSTLIVPELPNRSNSPSWITRSSLGCSSSGSSPISSRKRVAPSATSKRPNCLAWAPVKAPFSWPNSSLSMRFEGSVAQFTFTNARSLRGLK